MNGRNPESYRASGSTRADLTFECMPFATPPLVASVLPGEALLVGRGPDFGHLGALQLPRQRVDGGRHTLRLPASAASGLSSSQLLLWYTDIGLRIRNVGTPPVRWQGWGQPCRADFVSRHPDGELVELPMVTLWMAHDPAWRVGLVNDAGTWPAAARHGAWRTVPDESRIRLEASQLEAVLHVFAEFFDFPARQDPRIRKSTDLPGRYNVFRHRLERLWQTAVRDGRWRPPQDERPTSVTESLLRFLLRTGSVTYADVAKAVDLGTVPHISMMRPLPLWESPAMDSGSAPGSGSAAGGSP